MTIDHSVQADALLRRAPVIPVIVIDDVEAAVPLARALVAGGLPVLEITLRTPRALACLKAMTAVPGAIVGAGTVLDGTQMRAAEAAGARFLISPGHTPGLLDAADLAVVPFIPGVTSAGEALVAAERGYRCLKFFPAESVGGAGHLRALAAPLPDLTFCPTGGITAATAPAYLTLPNVACVGGSWVTPAEAVRQGDWDRIECLAREASTLRPRVEALRERTPPGAQRFRTARGSISAPAPAPADTHAPMADDDLTRYEPHGLDESRR